VSIRFFLYNYTAILQDRHSLPAVAHAFVFLCLQELSISWLG